MGHYSVLCGAVLRSDDQYEHADPMAEDASLYAAICTRCGLMFRTPAPPPIGTIGGPGVRFESITVSVPCLRCGADSNIVGLTVVASGDVTLHGDAATDFDALLGLILTATEQIDVLEIADQIEAQFPTYRPFAQFLRDNPWLATLGAALIAPILTVLLTHWMSSPPQSVHEVTRIIQRCVVIDHK